MLPSFETLAGDRAGGLLIIADHASNRVPAEFGHLGLPPAEFERHIGYDIGIAPLTRLLSAALDAPAVLSTFSRLLIDPNRGEDDPTLVMRLSDGAVVPRNARHTPEDRQDRIDRFWRPYHDEIARVLDAMLATGRVPFILSLHSYTPSWKGVPRPWHAGVLWDRDPRLAERLIAGLSAGTGLIVGDNEPYDGALEGDSLYRHGTARGLAHAILEVRNDLITEADGIRAWAGRIAALVAACRADDDLHVIRHYGSRCDLRG